MYKRACLRACVRACVRVCVCIVKVKMTTVDRPCNQCHHYGVHMPNLLLWIGLWTCLTPSCLRRGTGKDRYPSLGRRETTPNATNANTLLTDLALRCHHQKDSCITMGSDESDFNIVLINLGGA